MFLVALHVSSGIQMAVIEDLVFCCVHQVHKHGISSGMICHAGYKAFDFEVLVGKKSDTQRKLGGLR